MFEPAGAVNKNKADFLCLLGPHVCVCGVNSHIKVLPGGEKHTDPVTCNDAERRRSRETRLLAVKMLLISVTS